MTEITKYKCEVCGNVFDSKQKAEFCEGFHLQIDRLSIGLPIYERGGKYPKIISVFGEDGTSRRYHVEKLY